MKWTLIYCDDQIQNIEMYQEILGEHFYVIGCQNNTIQEALKEHHPHCFLLDVHMPGKGGLEVYKEIIENPLYNGCPVFFISGDVSDQTKIRALESGAVDFISRDVAFKELILRLGNKVRMFLQVSTVLELGNLRIDVQTLRTSINGESIDLTLLEMRILGFLLRAFPQTITRSEIIKKIWGDEPVKPGTINTHLTNLRPKLVDWDYVIKTRDDNVFTHPKPKN